MKITTRICLLTIICCMMVGFLNNSVSASSILSDGYLDTIVLIENSEGIYEVANVNVRSGILVTAMDGNEIYQSSNNEVFMRIDESRFMKAQVITIDATSYTSSNTRDAGYPLSDLLLEDINKIMVKVSGGEIELTEPLTVYIPEVINTGNNSKSVTSTTTTYTGYANRQYYQEVLHCKGNSLEFNVNMPNSPFMTSKW